MPSDTQAGITVGTILARSVDDDEVSPNTMGHAPSIRTPAAFPHTGSHNGDPPAHRIGFLLVPGFSYIAFACAIEPLRIANMAAGKTLFEPITASVDGVCVTASNGVRTLPDHSIRDMPSVTT